MNADDLLGNVTSISAGAAVATLPPVGLASTNPVGIKIDKTTTLSPETGKQVEVFTMTLGAETIQLLPLRNWGQLDVYKWGVRGKLPGTPAGLEVSFEHVKLAGEVVSPKQPDGCARLEKLFEEWLALEKGTAELAGKKLHSKPSPRSQDSSSKSGPPSLRFHVEIDKRQQVHIECVQGNERIASIGLNPAGFNSLVSQGLIRKPGQLKVGALHDWVELDGVLCSFEKGFSDTEKLEQLLNAKYLPTTTLGQGKNVVIFSNAASSTGFDIQFPITIGGAMEKRRRHLGEDALELLQDPGRCDLLQPRLQIKLTRPCLVFKEKTPDGGERYLEKRSENLVTVIGDDGTKKTIDLSQPVNYMHLSAVELTAVFNHPAVNRHTEVEPAETATEIKPASVSDVVPTPHAPVPTLPESTFKKAIPEHTEGLQDRSRAMGNRPAEPPEPSPTRLAGNTVSISNSAFNTTPEPIVLGTLEPPIPATPNTPLKEENQPQPNLWLKPLLAQEPIRHDWLVYLVYNGIAQKFGNSREDAFGDRPCWAIALGEAEAISDPEFKGIFLTEKAGLGFLSKHYVARFNRGVAFVGNKGAPLEGIGLRLLAVGFDALQRIVFIVDGNYRSKFDVPEQTIVQTLARLRDEGMVILDTREALECEDALEVVWTVPSQQEDPAEPQALESVRPTNGT